MLLLKLGPHRSNSGFNPSTSIPITIGEMSLYFYSYHYWGDIPLLLFLSLLGRCPSTSIPITIGEMSLYFYSYHYWGDIPLLLFLSLLGRYPSTSIPITIGEISIYFYTYHYWGDVPLLLFLSPLGRSTSIPITTRDVFVISFYSNLPTVALISLAASATSAMGAVKKRSTI